MRCSIWLILSVLAVLAPRVAAAQHVLTPREAIAAAVERNPAFAETGLAVEQAELELQAQTALRPWTLAGEGGVDFREQPTAGVIEAGVRQSRSYRGSVELLKQFVIGTSLSARLDLNRNVLNVPFTVPGFGIDEIRTIGPNYGTAASVSINQPILRGFGRDLGRLPEDLARAQVSVAEAQRLQAAETLVSEVLRAYWNWVRANLEAAARRAGLERTKLLAEATLAQIEAGQLAELERDIVDQRLAAAEQAILLAEASVVDAALELREVMGVDLAPEDAWRAPQNLPPDPDTLPELSAVLEAAQRRSPELVALDRQIEAAELRLTQSRDATRPQLDAVANLSQLGLSEEFPEALAQVVTLDYTAYFLGLVFRIPLDNGFARNRLRADELEVERARLRRDDIRRAIELRARQARRALAVQKRRLALSEKEVALGQRNLAAMREKFTAGLASYLEVLQLEEELEEAELRYTQARIDVVLARIALQRLSGTLLDSYDVRLSGNGR